MYSSVRTYHKCVSHCGASSRIYACGLVFLCFVSFFIPMVVALEGAFGIACIFSHASYVFLCCRLSCARLRISRILLTRKTIVLTRRLHESWMCWILSRTSVGQELTDVHPFAHEFATLLSVTVLLQCPLHSPRSVSALYASNNAVNTVPIHVRITRLPTHYSIISFHTRVHAGPIVDMCTVDLKRHGQHQVNALRNADKMISNSPSFGHAICYHP